MQLYPRIDSHEKPLQQLNSNGYGRHNSDTQAHFSTSNTTIVVGLHQWMSVLALSTAILQAVHLKFVFNALKSETLNA